MNSLPGGEIRAVTLLSINPTEEQRQAARAWGIEHFAFPQRFTVDTESNSARDA